MVLTLGATAALSFQQSPGAVQFGIDANPEGNGANTLGPADTCRSVQPGEAFEVDIYVKGVPSPESLGGFGYNLHFDPALLRVTAINNKFIIDTDTPFQLVDGDYLAGTNGDPLPATTGNMRLDYGRFGGAPISGDGVASRVTLEALTAGRSELVLADDLEGGNAPGVYTPDGRRYAVGQLQNAIVEIGTTCGTNDAPTAIILETPPPATATPAPGESGSPNGTSGETPTIRPTEEGSTPVPPGSTKLAVDAISESNDAASVDSMDECAAADVGDVFTVDVVIEDVEDLLAFESTIAYDPEVLSVADRDVELFLDSEDGSQVVDTSAQVPDDSGQYTAGGVDTADPLSPESGSGILVRLTMEAVADGTSTLSVGPIDLNDDNHADKGAFLRNVDGITIGDEDNDTFFDGDIADAEIRVGETCDDADARVTLAGDVDEPSASPVDRPGGDDDDGSLLWILLGVGAVVIVIAAGGYFLMRSRRSAGP